MGDRIILACDYEGTYHRHHGHPEESEVAAVKAFRAEGNLFGIVTEKDVFCAMADSGEYEEVYDFLICSTGGCCVSRRMPIGSESGAHTRLFTETATRFYLNELYDLFESAGKYKMSVDVFGFLGGDSEGFRFLREFDRNIDSGCNIQYWGGAGVYHCFRVNRVALSYVTPFSQCRATFKNSITAEGVAGEVNRRYYGRLRAYSSGTDVVVVPAHVNKSAAVARVAEYVGASAGDVWTCGDGMEDICMLEKFNGIAMSDGCPAAIAAAKYTAPTVAEAIEIIKRSRGDK